MCFMAQNVVSLLVNIPCELEKNVYSVFGWTTWIDTDVHYIQLIDSAFQFNYTFTDFLPMDLSVTDKGVLTSLAIIIIISSVVSDSVSPWTAAHQAPPSVGFPRKNTGVGCHSPLQGICLTQGLPHCRHQGSPTTIMDILKYNCGFICFSMQSLVFASCIFDPLFIHIKDCYFFFEELTQLSLYNAPLYHGVKNWYYFFKYSTKFTSEAIWLLHGKI